MTYKQHFATFVLFLYNEHIKEDWHEWNSIGKIVIYPFWLIRALVIWLVAPLYLPEYFIKRSAWYTRLDLSFQDFLETNTFDSNLTNKVNTNTFLNQKYGAGQFKFKVGKKNKNK